MVLGGHPDVVWQEPASGRSAVWFLGGTQGTTITGSAALSGNNVWRIVAQRARNTPDPGMNRFFLCYYPAYTMYNRVIPHIVEKESAALDKE